MSETPFRRESDSCVRCDGTGTDRGRKCGRCGGDGWDYDFDANEPMDYTPLVDADTARFERYDALLGGEIIGLVLGGGIVLAIAADPYVGLLLVLASLVFHLAARKATRG